MAAITICSDIGAQENKTCQGFHFFPCICHEVMGPVAMILDFWKLSFKPAFSLSSFTLIKRLFSSSSLTAIRVVSFAYMEKARAPHSSTLAWKLPWVEEPGRLQSMGLLRVGHDWATSLSVMAKNEEELKSLLIKVKDEGEKVGLKLNIQKNMIMASDPITSWQIDGETVADFTFSKITADGDFSHEIKRCLLFGRKVMTSPEKWNWSLSVVSNSLRPHGL